MINMEGELQWSTGSPDEQLFVMPLYLTVGSGFGPATVLVSDRRKHTITVLDADSGKLIKVCDVEGRKPKGITGDNCGTVYVLYPGHKRSVFGLERWWREIGQLSDSWTFTPGQYVILPDDKNLLLEGSLTGFTIIKYQGKIHCG